MLQLHSGGMHHQQWWVWLQDGGKAIDDLMHGITISASVSRKQKEMIVDFRRDGNSQPTCTLDEQLWEWSLALKVPENLNWSYNTSFVVKKTHQCLCFLKMLEHELRLNVFYGCGGECPVLLHLRVAWQLKKPLLRMVKAAQVNVGCIFPMTTTTRGQTHIVCTPPRTTRLVLFDNFW